MSTTNFLEKDSGVADDAPKQRQRQFKIDSHCIKMTAIQNWVDGRCALCSLAIQIRQGMPSPAGINGRIPPNSNWKKHLQPKQPEHHICSFHHQPMVQKASQLDEDLLFLDRSITLPPSLTLSSSNESLPLNGQVFSTIKCPSQMVLMTTLAYKILTLWQHYELLYAATKSQQNAAVGTNCDNYYLQ